MPDSEHPPERGIERDLRDLGARIEYPPTPDLARSVRLRLDEEDADHQARRGRHRPSFLSPRWAVPAAAIVLITFALLSPVVRDALPDLFVSAAGSGGGAAVSEAGDSAARPENGESAGRSGRQAEAGSQASQGEVRPESGGGESVASRSSLAESGGGTAARAGAPGCPSPYLEIKPARAAPGASFRLYGNNLSSGCEGIRPARGIRIDFLQDGKTWRLATVDADRRLTFDTGLRVPAGATPGQATVRATTRSAEPVEERFVVLQR